MAEEEEKKTKRPENGPFRQQRLPAWQPVLIPRNVLPTLFIFGIIFCPIGGLLYWNSGRVNEIMINYSYCGQYTQPVYLADSLFDYQFGSDVNITQMQPPAYHVENSTSFLDPSWQNPNNLAIPQCILDFTVPSTMVGPIYMYYRLTNFYQNHRLYVKNLDADQLLGTASQGSTIHTNCDPLATNDEGLWIYPCGLIANSMFNDTASNFTMISGSSQQQYNFSTSNIAWPTDKQKYKPTQYTNNMIAPPPNWSKRYPNGRYDDQHPPPDLSTMERFMVWMHVAALPDFRKIWARNDNDNLEAGRWRVAIDMNFDTLQYEGTKWLVLSTTTPLGGRNPYLGIAYMAIGALCLFLGLVFTLRHLIRPRKLGDPSYLSWNQPGGGLPKNKRAKHLHKDWVLTVLCLYVFAQSTVHGRQSYCEPGLKPSQGSPYELDLSKLDLDMVIEEATLTHPYTTKIQTQINICNPLSGMGDGEGKGDTCDKGAYVCRRKIFSKDNNDIVAVVQNIAGEFDGKFKPGFTLVGSTDDPSKVGTQYSLTLNGGTDLNMAQSAIITLECDQQDKDLAPARPVPVSYQNNVLSITWKTIHACAYKTGERPPDKGNGGSTDDSSGGWTFFKILLVMAAIYLVGGALYNFNQYNARGLDLIPHRDFWLDLPYVIRDLISHCVDSVMSRRRGGGGQGYVAV